MTDREYVGCIHVHSSFSDGHTPAGRILEIAAAVGLDFVVISDHDRDAVRDAGLTGWRGGLLSVSAPEVGARGRAHFLAFGLRDPAALKGQTAVEAIEAAQRQGARNFVAHPHPARMRAYLAAPGGWNAWDCSAFCGLEIWSYMHDVCHKVIPWRLHRLWRSHESLVRGPRPETLRQWDALCAGRRVAAIGGLDNHARYLPLVGEILPHEELFRLQRTHVVCGPLPADGDAAEIALAEAMAQGQAFVAMDGWADAAGFRLRVDGPDTALGFGQEAPWRPGLRLTVNSPVAADLAVLRDGAPIATREKCDRLELAVEAPGVYRVEARLGDRPWVFTNPIYLRGEGRSRPRADEPGQER